MAIQIGTVDGLINISEEKIRCLVNAIAKFSQGGVSYARENGVSLGAAFQRFVEPVYTKIQKDFRFSDIINPVYTKGGKEQSPARGTFCRKMGLLMINDENDKFELTPLAQDLYANKISIEEYAFILLSKQGIFKDGKYVQNLLVFISEWFNNNAVISEKLFTDYVTNCLNDTAIEKTRVDIILNALSVCGIISSMGNGIFVLSNLKYTEILSDYSYNRNLLSYSYRDDDEKYTDYIGSFNYGGIFDVLSSSNLTKYTLKYPNLSRYINAKENNKILIKDPLQIVPSSSPLLTAIRTKPFVLLAGISGTGKSRIVRELARACWKSDDPEYKAHKPRNFEMVQVKPNWHDSSELIGYVSRIGEKPEFIAGDFLKFIDKAWSEPDVPHFLCLDEMNLAPVEQYFAEYLSVIESRKLEDGEIVTDPLLKKEVQDWYQTLVYSLTSDGSLQDQFLKEGIAIPQNLFVIGTVNMDETTFSFSRKVLDRAMTIEMNEVDLYGGLQENEGNEFGYIGNSIIPQVVEGKDVYASNKELCDKVIAFLTEVNKKLDKTPFKIAYRTRNEFLIYAVCRGEYNLLNALDEMTSMKILSRIEGDSEKTSIVLDGLESFLREQFKGLEKSVSIDKIEEMKEKLGQTGYTSFWS